MILHIEALYKIVSWGVLNVAEQYIVSWQLLSLSVQFSVTYSSVILYVCKQGTSYY